ncbi:hypothetical protein N665_0019s0029 [Sinapis alba]|nr:hypothetical protein N665_0019s0029 [Sinapis alba]
MQSDLNRINVVPIGNEFFDLMTLSRFSHKGFKLNRLCKLYTHQVTKTQLTFRNKLSNILHDFRRLDEDIHPLYIDLLCFASAVVGMFGVVNEITPRLAYLEQLRQHMVKLSLIDPDVPTLLVSGYPHVDKASFMSIIINFTTKYVAFNVGHTDYNDLMRSQVIDAPGVLDKPVFGECSVVINALARHLRDSLVLFFLDVSGSCGYSIAEQLIEEMNGGMGEEEREVGFKISDLRTEEGVIYVKNAACERLLDQRGRLSCIALEEARVLRNKYIELEHGVKHSKEEEEDHKGSEYVFVDSDVLFTIGELEHEEVKQSEEEKEEEDDDFVMAEERFTEEHKDQLVAIHKIQPLRILKAFGFCILVGNTYGAVQQCLSTLRSPPMVGGS